MAVSGEHNHLQYYIVNYLNKKVLGTSLWGQCYETFLSLICEFSYQASVW
jgi:hypothetical protein